MLSNIKKKIASARAAAAAAPPSLRPSPPACRPFQRQQTPLMLCASNANAVRVCECLLEAGADVDAASADLGMTPLLYACKDANVAAIKLLLQAGASPTQADVSARTCFHYAVLACPPATVRELNARTRGALLNAADCSGYTPLMLAAEHGRVDTARDLLEAGANPALRNKLNHQAIELADWFGQKKIVEELEAWFRRSGLTVRGERVDGDAGGTGAGTSPAGRPAPASPASLSSPHGGGLFSPSTPATTPHGGGAAGAHETFAAEAARAADAQDPVGASLAAARSTVPFASF